MAVMLQSAHRATIWPLSLCPHSHLVSRVVRSR
jgi:hypothetical protein